MTEPPRPRVGVEGWAPGLVEPGGDMAISRRWRDRGPLTEVGWTRCGWGLASGSVAGLQACWVCPCSSTSQAIKRRVRTGGRLAPRCPVMTEPPRAAGGRRDEGWAPSLMEPGGDVAISRRWHDRGPLTEVGWTRCSWGLTSGSVAGLQACWVRPRSSPFPALKRACALVGVWRLEVPQ